jgi:hypothetical protein
MENNHHLYLTSLDKPQPEVGNLWLQPFLHLKMEVSLLYFLSQWADNCTELVARFATHPRHHRAGPAIEVVSKIGSQEDTVWDVFYTQKVIAVAQGFGA